MDVTDPMAAAVAAKGGFKRKRKVYELDFSGTDLDGLTAKVRSAPIGLFLQIGQLADQLGELEGVEDVEAFAKVTATVNDLVGVFEQVLVSWDLLDDDDRPIPADAQGLLALEMDELMLLITAWQNAAAAVPDPLPAASTSGSPSLVGSMPMEPLSQSQAS